MTNEANCHEEVKSSNYTTHIGITTNSDVDSGLDKGEIDHDFDGGEADGDAKCGEGLRVPRPAAVGGEAAADGGRRLGAGMKTRSVGEAAPTQSVGARGIENSSSERGGTSQTLSGRRHGRGRASHHCLWRFLPCASAPHRRLRRHLPHEAAIFWGQLIVRFCRRDHPSRRFFAPVGLIICGVIYTIYLL